jgi:hypothetical protein
MPSVKPPTEAAGAKLGANTGIGAGRELAAATASPARGNYQDTVYQIETTGGKTKSTHLGGASNKYQFTPAARAQYQPHGSDWNDPHVQDQTLFNEKSHHSTLLRGALGREPTEPELFITHNQGYSAGSKMLRFPDKSPAELGVNPKYIAGNSPDRTQNYANSPSKNFIGGWQKKWDAAHKSLLDVPSLNDPIGSGLGIGAGHEPLDISGQASDIGEPGERGALEGASDITPGEPPGPAPAGKVWKWVD